MLDKQNKTDILRFQFNVTIGNIMSSINVQKTKETIIHISNLMAEQDNMREDIKAAIEAQSDALGIDKKVLRKLAVIHNKQTLSQVKSEFDDVISTYESIMTS